MTHLPRRVGNVPDVSKFFEKQYRNKDLINDFISQRPKRTCVNSLLLQKKKKIYIYIYIIQSGLINGWQAISKQIITIKHTPN